MRTSEWLFEECAVGDRVDNGGGGGGGDAKDAKEKTPADGPTVRTHVRTL